MPNRQDIISWCNQFLQISAFQDYAPNGLQVEGRENVRKIVCAVTASLAAIDYAVQQEADMLLVHHGLFWKSEPITITGWKHRRIAALLRHNINLAGYHLPLDAHPEVGNNAQLAQRLGWRIDGQTGEQNLLMYGAPPSDTDGAALVAQLAAALGRQPVAAGDLQRSVRRLFWCSGGAQGFFRQAIDLGANAFVTGEISEAQYHLAKENGTLFISAGHHATERYGIQALAGRLQQEFALECRFFDEDNPA
ncbi:Nif3-like dinuclear metal center hexameric protein [Eikenella sp. Marseille-P7795]|uniref:Nif3-like dinuclear metal center hexameric protein n=1 Tax=Eikenella sp. Marseille-P7795 TaxID=2866577 RepID=UPI001CE3D0D9|nr:Nif3-like dinuclear metal center hexameric protein [Eikenella sp. Marseille-P7795]